MALRAAALPGRGPTPDGPPARSFLAFARLLFDLIEAVEADQRLDTLAHVDRARIGHPGPGASLSHLDQSTFGRIQSSEQEYLCVYAGPPAHFAQLIVVDQGPPIA